MIGDTESCGSSIEVAGEYAGHSREESRAAKAWVLWLSAFLFAPARDKAKYNYLLSAKAGL